MGTWGCLYTTELVLYYIRRKGRCQRNASRFILAVRSDGHDIFTTSTQPDRSEGDGAPSRSEPGDGSPYYTRRPVPCCTGRWLALPAADLAPLAVDRGDCSHPRQSECRTDTALAVGGRSRARRRSGATLGGASYRRHLPNAQRSPGSFGFDRTLFIRSQSPLSRQHRAVGRLCGERAAFLDGAAHPSRARP